MVNIENWVVWPEAVELPITTQNLYTAYGLQLPDKSLIDEKMRVRLGMYLLQDYDTFEYTEFRKKYIVMFLSISPSATGKTSATTFSTR